MPETRPQYGLPFKQLPQHDLTPESMLDEERRTGQQRIQSKYALQWKTAIQSKRFIGQGKVQRMLRDIDTKAKQEMLQFNQQMQQQVAQLQNVNRLAQQGAISNPDEIKARMAFGPDIAKSMYPSPEKERSIPQQFGELDVFSQRISDELKLFRTTKEEMKPPSMLYGLAGPLVYGTVAARRLAKAKRAKPKLQILDYSLPSGEKDEFGDPVMGKYRKADEQETQFYDFYKGLEKQVTEEKRRIAGQLDVSQRITRPGAKGGTFDSGVAGSIKSRQAPAVTKPKVIKQRNTRTGQTRVSYDGGKTWQTSG